METELDERGLGGFVRETELLVPWLEIEALRDLADDSSCESDKDCETDLHNAVRTNGETTIDHIPGVERFCRGRLPEKKTSSISIGLNIETVFGHTPGRSPSGRFRRPLW